MRVLKEAIDSELKDKLIDYVSECVETALDNLESSDLSAMEIHHQFNGYDPSYCSEEWSQKSLNQRDEAIDLLSRIYLRELLANA